jgi:hypothetical protein
LYNLEPSLGSCFEDVAAPAGGEAHGNGLGVETLVVLSKIGFPCESDLETVTTLSAASEGKFVPPDVVIATRSRVEAVLEEKTPWLWAFISQVAIQLAKLIQVCRAFGVCWTQELFQVVSDRLYPVP